MGESMNKKSQSSLVDLFTNNMQFSNKVLIPLSTNSKQAKNLYSIFISAMDSNGILKMARPLHMSTTDFIELQMAGLIAGSDGDLSFTKQGKRMIEKMILADDDCTFALKTNVDKGMFSKKSQDSAVDNLLPRTSGVFRI